MPNRFWGRVADAFIPGNAYNNTTGRWNPNTAKVGLASMAAGLMGPPGADQFVQKGASSGWFGSGLADGLRNENIYNNLADQYGQTKSSLADYLHSQKVDVGGYHASVGQMTPISIGSYAPTMPQVNAQAPWSGLGTSTGNTFNGGSLGQWANAGGGGAPQGLHYSNGVGAGTGYGASSYANDKWGDMAMGFGVGATSGTGGFALSDAIRANRRNKD
jgi:hypothetical protein